MIGEVAIVMGPALPLWLSIPAALLWIALVMWVALRLRDRLAAFVVLSFLFRYLLAAFHPFTFRASPAGLSWNALGSLLIMGIGVLMITPRHLVLRFLVPVYLLIVVATTSAVINADPSGYISAVTKFGYLIIMMLAIYGALERVGDRLMPAVLTVFSGPVLLQLGSAALGIAKASEGDGSKSFIGGFAHEASFSMILATGLLAATLSRSLRPRLINFLVLVFVTAIFVANYRTTILAFAPLLLAQLGVSMIGAVPPRQRFFASISILVTMTASVLALAAAGGDRFADVANLGRIPKILTEPTSALERSDERILSGRAKIWNLNIQGYWNGPAHGYLIGAGPEERAPGALLYPHNTLISALYEYGLAGVLVYLSLWFGMMRIAWKVRSKERLTLVTAHVSFLILNMATMPFWNIEGTLLYAMLCGYSCYRYRATRNVPQIGAGRAAPPVLPDHRYHPAAAG